MQPIFFYPVPFSRYKGPIRTKKLFQWNVNLLPYHVSKTHYCVQHITVSNTLLCQPSTRRIFIWTFLLSTCCGRIMLRLRSSSGLIMSFIANFMLPVSISTAVFRSQIVHAFLITLQQFFTRFAIKG